MVDMNSDHIFEVPDTPDRIQQPTCPVSSSAATRGITAVNIFEVPDTPDRVQLPKYPVSSSAATRGITRMRGDPSPNRIMKFKIKNYSSNQGQSSRGSATGELRAPLATGDLFKQAEVARLLPEAKQSPPKLDRATGKSVVNGYGARTLGLGQSSSISNNMISGAGVSGNSCQIREGKFSHRDASRRNMDFLGVGSSLPTMPVGKPQNRAKSSTSNGLKEAVGTDDFSQSSPTGDKREAVNFKGTAGLSSLTPCDVPNKHVGQRKWVRNGFISPSNIVQRNLKADEKQEMCSTSGVLHRPDPRADVSHEGNIIDLTDSPTVTRKGNTATDRLITRNVGSLVPQGANQASSSNCSEGFNNKGKEIIHDLMHTERSGEDNTMRVCPRGVVDSSVVNGDISGISSQQGWRRTHNHTSKLSRSLLDTMTTSCGIESGSSGPSNQGHETAVGDSNNSFSAATTTRSTSGTTKISKGKRKLTSSSYYPGDSSSSLHEHSGSCLASSDTTAGRNHTTVCHDTPVIDIDNLYSPEVRPHLRGNHHGTSIGPNISAQLEADEMLARQLQEQLYNETPRVAPREDIDAIVAMSLQHEEDAVRTSRPVRRFQNETPRVAPREDIDAIVAMSLQHEEDAVRTSRPVRRFQNDTRAARASRSSAAQRAIRARYETAISDMRNAAPITLGLRAMIPGYPGLRIQPNIDLNDYDALLALDENNHQHTGASESQINNLPQSVFQSASTEEPCAVCLENPSVGDTIRTLPCFHKFHKDCIDEWLRRKKLCPVCKCGITRS
ncbi:uncharacterized protein LOC124674386 isoform X1 [Lolium rigidum]|uniref:uncharacterized protein LOC124674386 isoform X1 n=1 Tax=Lolium rigidum TaxID=89674 RepID=UPI001F5D54A5|nr:uncharacterized protein LOC124674386 isoform X1 [Lolium rigidum]